MTPGLVPLKPNNLPRRLWSSEPPGFVKNTGERPAGRRKQNMRSFIITCAAVAVLGLPAWAVEQMDFAIDPPPVGTVPAPGAAVKPSASAGGLAAETLLGGRPVRAEASKEPKNRVIVLLKDVFQRENEVFIRYAVRNGSK